MRKNTRKQIISNIVISADMERNANAKCGAGSQSFGLFRGAGKASHRRLGMSRALRITNERSLDRRWKGSLEGGRRMCRGTRFPSKSAYKLSLEKTTLQSTLLHLNLWPTISGEQFVTPLLVDGLGGSKSLSEGCCHWCPCGGGFEILTQQI